VPPQGRTGAQTPRERAIHGETSDARHCTEMEDPFAHSLVSSALATLSVESNARGSADQQFVRFGHPDGYVLAALT